ncbi:Protein translocase subunit SecD [Dissostichus eleginoides]|uniref:Protein translocase subunit SecD n=1 Tax=Dissostichus eleginoides TaxID=100907 RepID=A0AAD9EYS0_DISEL|nr:Protein translocase subunit SecD [Dissostichus eleginoides]
MSSEMVESAALDHFLQSPPINLLSVRVDVSSERENGCPPSTASTSFLSSPVVTGGSGSSSVLPGYKPANGVVSAAALLHCRRAETNRIQSESCAHSSESAEGC